MPSSSRTLCGSGVCSEEMGSEHGLGGGSLLRCKVCFAHLAQHGAAGRGHRVMPRGGWVSESRRECQQKAFLHQLHPPCVVFVVHEFDCTGFGCEGFAYGFANFICAQFSFYIVFVVHALVVHDNFLQLLPIAGLARDRCHRITPAVLSQH